MFSAVLPGVSLLLILFISNGIEANVYPMQFSISESKIVQEIPHKDRDFAFIIPGKIDTYIYTEEAEYYKDYQRSYFAITSKKSGWDCLRHYEILANGCIPYFVNLDTCDPNTMKFLPKELILEAMHLPGVSYGAIDHAIFNTKRYYEILDQLLAHTREYLTAKRMAEYLLTTINYSGNGKILFLTDDLSPDYLRCCTLIGMKELLNEKIVDVPKITHIYTSYPGNTKHLYGRGMSYTQIVDDPLVDRENIEERIKNKEFDLIIYGSVHRGLRYHDLVLQTYDHDKIIYICGEDRHYCPYLHLPHLFLREFEDNIPKR